MRILLTSIAFAGLISSQLFAQNAQVARGLSAAMTAMKASGNSSAAVTAFQAAAPNVGRIEAQAYVAWLTSNSSVSSALQSGSISDSDIQSIAKHVEKYSVNSEAAFQDIMISYLPAASTSSAASASAQYAASDAAALNTSASEFVQQHGSPALAQYQDDLANCTTEACETEANRFASMIEAASQSAHPEASAEFVENMVTERTDSKVLINEANDSGLELALDVAAERMGMSAAVAAAKTQPDQALEPAVENCLTRGQSDSLSIAP